MIRKSNIIWLILVVFLMIPHKVIVIRQDSHVLLYDTIVEENQFTIRSIHSVSLTPIIESYIYLKGKIINYETVYFDQGGAGLPDVLSEDDFIVVDEDGIKIQRKRPISLPLYVLVDKNSQWSLTFKQKSITMTTSNELNINIEQHVGIYYLYHKVWGVLNEI